MNSRPTDTPLHPAIIPAAVIASGLVAPVDGWSAPGDLDASFGDVGRLQSISDASGAVWSIEASQDGYLLAGSYEHCYLYCVYGEFAVEVDAHGGLNPGYTAARLDNVIAFDVVMQPDGKALAAGRIFTDESADLAVYRLLADGSLDTAFGTGGVVAIPAPLGSSLTGRSVILDPEGRIVIAAVRGDGRLVVVRLLENGMLDESFGVDGLYVSSAIEVWAGDRPQILAVPTGYRVTGEVRTGNRSRCNVVALTAQGAVDSTFGVNGVARTPDPANESSYCSGIARDDDDNLLVASRNSSRGIVTRLTPAGFVDPTLAMAETSALLADVTAVASGRGGSIMIAGHDRSGLSGVVVARLLADGHLDTLFGRNGTSSVDLDLDFDFATTTTVNKMLVLEDGGVILAGGYAGASQPFAAKLLGDGGGDSPGVLAFSNVYTDAAEQDGQALVTIRRVGGSSGAVSVAVATSEEEGYPPATPDEDFTMVQTTLHWDDGDVSDRQFAVPLAADGGTERAEAFFVRLSDVEGGAGLGTRRSVVQIRGDGYPGGLFTIEPLWLNVAEGADEDQFVVYRNEYWGGRVSVTVTPIGGTATPDSDFVASPITLTWEDGDTTPKQVSFETRDDDLEEGDETLVVALSAASGGAIVGDPAESQITLRDPIKLDPPAVGGSGRFDALLAALLGLGTALRSRRADRRS